MPIRLTGMASGLDTDALIKQMMQAKRMPIDKMKQQQTKLSWQRDQYREMNTLMSQLRDVANNIRFASTVNAKKVTTNNAAVTATATAGTAVGSYSLTVNQVATSAKIQGTAIGVSSSTPLNTTAASVLTINGVDVNINLNSNANDIVNAINNKSSSTGVKATFDAITQRFTLTNSKTGVNSKINIVNKSGEDVLAKMNLGATSATGLNANVSYNGAPSASFETNSFTIEGVNFQLKETAGATYPMNVNVSIEQDTDKIFDTIKSFVDKYNEVIDKVNKKTTEQRYRDFQPLTEEQKKEMKDTEIEDWEKRAKSGLLRNDAALNSAIGEFRSLLMKPVTGVTPGAYDMLSDIGISTSQPGNKFAFSENGKLYIDEAKLKNALSANPDQVSDLFTKGYGESMYQAANKSLSKLTKMAGNGTSLVDSSTLGLQITDLDRRIDVANSKLKDYEDRYYIQFSKLESALTKMQEQQSWLSSQTSGM